MPPEAVSRLNALSPFLDGHVLFYPSKEYSNFQRGNTAIIELPNLLSKYTCCHFKICLDAGFLEVVLDEKDSDDVWGFLVVFPMLLYASVSGFRFIANAGVFLSLVTPL